MEQAAAPTGAEASGDTSTATEAEAEPRGPEDPEERVVREAREKEEEKVRRKIVSSLFLSVWLACLLPLRSPNSIMRWFMVPEG